MSQKTSMERRVLILPLSSRRTRWNTLRKQRRPPATCYRRNCPFIVHKIPVAFWKLRAVEMLSREREERSWEWSCLGILRKLEERNFCPICAVWKGNGGRRSCRLVNWVGFYWEIFLFIIKYFLLTEKSVIIDILQLQKLILW